MVYNRQWLHGVVCKLAERLTTTTTLRESFDSWSRDVQPFLTNLVSYPTPVRPAAARPPRH